MVVKKGEVEDDSVEVEENETETEDEVTEEELESIDHIKGDPETVRETLERTLKETTEEETEEETEEGKEDGVKPLTAPEDWDDEAKKFFPGIKDRKTQEFILARHKAYADASKDQSTFKQIWDPVAKIVEPYMESLKKAGVKPEQVIQRYINAELYLQRDPVGCILWFMENYKVTPRQLVDGIKAGKDRKPGAKPNGDGNKTALDPNDPRDKIILDLQQKEQDREKQANDLKEREAEKARKDTDDAVAAMAAEKDKGGNAVYPHIGAPEIKRLMGTFLMSREVDIQKEGGILPALKKAYDLAVYAHVPTREAVIKARKEAEAKTAAEEEKRKVNKAKKLGSGLSGGGTSGTSQDKHRKGESVRETIRKSAESIGFNQ